MGALGWGLGDAPGGSTERSGARDPPQRAARCYAAPRGAPAGAGAGAGGGGLQSARGAAAICSGLGAAG